MLRGLSRLEWKLEDLGHHSFHQLSVRTFIAAAEEATISRAVELEKENYILPGQFLPTLYLLRQR